LVAFSAWRIVTRASAATAGKKKRLAPPELLESSQSLCFAVDSRSFADDYSVELLRRFAAVREEKALTALSSD
jgi:hypothetical protein